MHTDYFLTPLVLCVPELLLKHAIFVIWDMIQIDGNLREFATAMLRKGLEGVRMEVAGHGFIPNTMNEMNEQEAALPCAKTK
uniref:Uncharacterized protein n=1 Tax=Cucumis melo TaxID=3656 RepID=A0A9I9EF95_CUCME